MSEEEKEAIEHLKVEREYAWDGDIIEIALNYIDKLQKENKKYIDIFNSTEKIMNRQERTKDKLLKENVELQKENEELTNELSKIQCDNRQLELELEKANKQLDLDYVDNNFISKDKIREVLKDIYFYYGQNNDMLLVDKIREELLGE